MAEPDFSVTTPDWLKQGRDVGDEWLRMRADNRQQRELSMREREQAALLPLKQREAEQNLQLNGLRLGDEFKHRDDMIQAELAAQQLAQGPIADLLRQGKTEEALDAYLEAGIRNPSLRKAKSYGEMADDLRFSVQVKENLKLRREMEEGRNTRAQEALDARAARFAEGDMDATPYVAEFRGVPFLVNPKSGAAQRIRQEEMTDMQRLEYSQALRDISAIDRELSDVPPHPTGRDEKGEKVPTISDKRVNLLKQRRAVEERIGEIVAKQAQGTPVQAPTSSPPVGPPLTEFDSAESVRDAFRAGKLPKEDALRILKEKFGIE